MKKILIILFSFVFGYSYIMPLNYLYIVKAVLDMNINALIEKFIAKNYFYNWTGS